MGRPLSCPASSLIEFAACSVEPMDFDPARRSFGFGVQLCRVVRVPAGGDDVASSGRELTDELQSEPPARTGNQCSGHALFFSGDLVGPHRALRSG